jgi:UTP--glucose-1-phosphate uridylyltransferase
MSDIKKIRKAVIPAAGFGTRFLPQTKAMPKEMLPIVDKPVIQYVVEELVDAGITDIIMVTGYHKRTIEDHFDSPSADLIENLKMGGEKKRPLLESIQRISNMANFYYVRQKGPYGNGTPLMNIRDLIGDEPFIYIWSDDFIYATPSRTQQLIETYNQYGCSVLSSLPATKDEDYDRYGFGGGTEIEPGILDLTEIVEKPGKEKAPSNHSSISGYLFTAEIFKYLEEVLSNLQPNQEFYYIDALQLMLKNNERVLLKTIEGGKYYDTGNKLEYLKTVVEFALKNPEVGEGFKAYLKSLMIE